MGLPFFVRGDGMSNVSRNIVVCRLFKKASKNFPALHYVVTSIDISDKFENLNLQKIAYIPNALYIASCHLTSYSLLPQFIIISCGVYPVGQHINKIGFRVYPHRCCKTSVAKCAGDANEEAG